MTTDDMKKDIIDTIKVTVDTMRPLHNRIAIAPIRGEVQNRDASVVKSMAMRLRNLSARHFSGVRLEVCILGQ
jgi:hypothetical protein